MPRPNRRGFLGMKGNKKIISLAIAALAFLNCTAKKFNSAETLVHYFVSTLNNGNVKKFKGSLMSRDEYVTKVFPQTTDAKSGLSGTEFWQQFIALQRLNAVDKHFQLYAKCSLKVLNVDKAREILQEGSYRFHKKIPVKLEADCPGRSKEVFEDKAIFGIVIEDPDGKFSLMNVARD